MKAEDFVKSKFPNAYAVPIIDNARRQTSYVIVKGDFGTEYLTNEGARTASKAWTDAKKYLKSSEQKQKQ